MNFFINKVKYVIYSAPAAIVITSLAASLAIELYQLITRCGIFELDDIIDNTAGGIFGYFLIMALILSLRAKRPDISALLRVFIVPAAMALLIGAVVMI